MKKNIVLFVVTTILLFSPLLFSQEKCESDATNSKNIYWVMEYRHVNKLQKDEEDIKTSEVHGILRYMFSKKVGFTGTIRTNDSTTTALAGVTFMPADWVRFDILVGSQVGNQQKSMFGFRMYMGSTFQGLWVNLNEGDGPFWIEGIYMINPTEWLSLGGMVQTIGVGPRIELHLPMAGNLTIWGAVMSDWKNTATDGGYDPQTYLTIGVKAIF